MLKKFSVMAMTAFAAALVGFGFAQADFITNGDFSQFSYDTGTTHPGSDKGGQIDYNIKLTGWSSKGGYNFLYTPGVADLVNGVKDANGVKWTGATGVNGNAGGLALWGPNDGSANGFTAKSPTGGNFLAADGAYQTKAITQTINNLVVGKKYDVGFYWAGAQQHGFTGVQTEQWKVSLGDETHSTAVYTNPSHGFGSPAGAGKWQWEDYVFTATKSSEVLSFLAVGTPTGVPPFSLLSGVTMNAVATPEPNGMALMAVGMLCMGVVVAVRRKKMLALQAA